MAQEEPRDEHVFYHRECLDGHRSWFREQRGEAANQRRREIRYDR